MESKRQQSLAQTSKNTIQQRVEIPAEAIQQIVALEAEKDRRTPAQQKIDSQLLQAIRESRGQQMTSGVHLTPAKVNADTKGNLIVDIDAEVSDALITRIEALGGQIIYPSWQYNTIRAQISLSMVEAIASYADVKFIQPAVGSLTSHANDPTRDVYKRDAAVQLVIPLLRCSGRDQLDLIRGTRSDCVAGGESSRQPSATSCQ